MIVRGRVTRYTPLISAGLQITLRYRAAFLIGAATTVTTTALVIFLWRAIHEQSPGSTALDRFSLPELTTYLLLAQLLNRLHANRVDSEVGQEIMTGDIAVTLARPTSYLVTRFFLAIPVVLSEALLVALPVLAVFALLFPLQAPTAAGLMLFILAAAASIVLAFSVNLIAGIYAAVTTNTWGVSILKGSLIGLFSGALIPIELLPKPLGIAANLLPFKSMVDTPVRLFLGRYADGGEALGLLAHQLAWTAGFVVISTLLWHSLGRRLSVLGG